MISLRRRALLKSICFNPLSMITLGLLFAGCFSDPKVSPTDVAALAPNNGMPDACSSLKDEPLSTDVNPVHLDGHNTILPFPSDFIAYRDPSSPTGVRLKFDTVTVPPQMGLLPASLQFKNCSKSRTAPMPTVFPSHPASCLNSIGRSTARGSAMKTPTWPGTGAMPFACWTSPPSPAYSAWWICQCPRGSRARGSRRACAASWARREISSTAYTTLTASGAAWRR